MNLKMVTILYLYKFIENLNDPYSNEVNSIFQKGPTEDEKVHQTFCGT